MSQERPVRDQVTIAIPVYNEAAFIEETIESALAQGATVFVSDNASTDGTSEICQKYADAGEIVYVRHRRDMGSWLNFRYAVEQVETPWFMFLGGHDLLPPGYIERMLDAVREDEDAVLFYPVVLEWIDGEGRTTGQEPCSFCEASEGAGLFQRMRSAILVSQGTFIQGTFRTEALRRLWGALTELTVSPDMPLLWGAAALGRVRKVDAVYRRRDFRGPEDARAMIERQIRALCLEDVPPRELWERFEILASRSIALLRETDEGRGLAGVLRRALLKTMVLRRWRWQKKILLSLPDRSACRPPRG